MSDNQYLGMEDAAASVVRQDISTTASQIRNNVQYAVGANPDAEARIRRMASTVGVPIETARAEPEEIERQATVQSVDADRIAAQFPHFAKFLTDIDNVRLVHDDMPGTTNVEAAARSLPPQTDAIAWEPSMGQRLRMWLDDAFGLNQRENARAMNQLAANRSGITVDDARQSVGGMSETPMQFGSKFFHAATFGIVPDVAGTPNTTGGSVAGAGGSLVGFLSSPYAAAESVTGKLGLGMLERKATDSFAKSLLKDVTVHSVKLGTAGAIGGTGDAIDSPDVTTALQKEAHAFMTNAATGAVFGGYGRLLPENTFSQAIARIVGIQASLDVANGKTPFQDIANWDKLTPAEKGEAAFNILLNGVFGAKGSGRVAGGWFQDAAKAEIAVDDMAKLKTLSDVSAASKLRERDPEAFKNFVSQVVGDGQIKDVYVDARTFADALNQSGVQLPELEAKMPGLPEQLTEALQTNGDVRLSVPDYATHIAGTPVDAAILQHLKTAPDGSTYAQAQQFLENQHEALNATAAKLLADKAGDDVAQLDAQHVHDQVLSQLDATGRYRPEVSKAYAALTRDFYVTQAERMGITPKELYEQYPVRIVGETMTGGLDQGATLNDVQQAWDAAGIKHAISERDGVITLSKIVVPEAERGNGKGTAAMRELTDYADATGQHVVLSPSADFGGSKKRLVDFYKRFGFVENKGANRAFSTSETMYRQAAGKVLHQGENRTPTPDEILAMLPEADKMTVDAPKMSEQEIDDEQNRFLSNFEKGTRHTRDTGLLKRIRKASDKAADELGGSPEETRTHVGRLGPFSGYKVEGQILPGDSFHPDGLLAIHVYGNEQADVTHEPALTFTVTKDGELSVNGPTPGSEAFNLFHERGWADHAKGADGTPQAGWSALKDPEHPDRPLPISQLIPLLADVHARVREWRGEDYVGLHWSRSTGSLGGLFGDNPTAVFFQRPEQPRGKFDPETNTIALLKDADLSTYLHEAGHFFYEVMHDLAMQPDAPADVRADFDTLLKIFGETGATPEARLAEWTAKTLDEKRDAHEQFARSFEAYLMEGKAPSLGLQNLFARFRSWLLQIYKTLASLNVTLTPEVRGVMDRMLASDQAITEAETIRGYRPLFETAEQAGMTPEEFAAYRGLGQEATADAVSEMQARSMRDMKWMSNAKGRIIREIQAKAAATRREIRDQVTKEVMAEPINQARRYVQRGELDEAERPNATRRLFEDASMGSTKLSLEELKRMYGDGPAAPWRYLKPGRYGEVTAEGGLHPDIVAEMFGFNSGDDLVRGLLADDNPQEKIESITDQRMLEAHGEMVDAQSIERAAEEAIHNEARARFMATGLKALTKAPIAARTIHEAARQAAANAIGAKQIKELRPAQYAAAEARNNKAAVMLAPRDPQGAVDAQRAALLNNQLFKQASDAITFVERSLNYLKKFDKQSIRDKMEGAFLERIDQLRGTLDLRKSPTAINRAQESLQTWAEGLRNLGYEPQIADWLSELATPMHYADATVEQFRGVVDAVKSLEHIAREMKQVTINGKKMAVKEAVDKLNARMDMRGPKFTKAELLEKPTAETDGVWTSVTHWLGVHLRMVHGDLLSPEYKINRFDMHELQGPFRQIILDRILDANYRKVDLTKRQSDMMGKMGDELGREWQKSLYDSVPNRLLVDPDQGTTGTPIMLKMTRGRMLGIARHVGNESNFEKLIKGYGWKSEDVWQFLHENMTEKDWKATQAHWDSFEPLWTETEAMIRRQGGVPPPKIPAREFDTRFGTMRGGYSPIDYDPIRSKLAVRHGEFDLGPGDKIGEQINYRATTTHNSSMVARAQGYTDRVNLDFHTAEGRIRDTIHDLAYREALLDVGKIINDSGFRQKFMETYGREEYQALTDWLKGVRDMNAMDPRNRGFEKAMQYARQGVVLTGIGYRISTVLKHGGAAALKSLGYLGTGEAAKYFAARLARMASGHMQEDLAAAREKFPEIRARMLQMDRDYKIGNRSMYEAEGWKEKNDRFGHMMVAWSDALSAVPTAWAAYDLARTSGVPVSMGGTGMPMSEAEAVSYANSVVRQAHGSALEATRSNFMQAGSIKGFFGALYGFMNNTYGQTADMLDKSVSQGYFRNNPAVAARLFATLLIPAVWTQWLKDSGPSNDEHWYSWISKAIAAETAATVPFARDAVSLLEYGHSNQIAPLQMVTDVTTSAKNFWEEANGKQTRIVQDLSNAIGEWAHIAGLGQLGHILQYARDASEGKRHPESAAQAVKEAVIGGHAKH